MTKLFNRGVCLTLGIVALGFAGCASNPGQTASQSWTDKRTTSHVESALDKSPTYKYPAVNVSTYDGIVSLGGFVNNEAQKQQAIDIARSVPGVRQVIDNVVIKTEPTGRAPVVRNPDKIDLQPMTPQEKSSPDTSNDQNNDTLNNTK